jgi:hypothetical protein
MGGVMKGSSKAATPEEYIDGLPEPRRGEISELHKLIRATVPGLAPTMEFGMIGYGKYRYKYASGREGDWITIALASQKNYISVYVCSMDETGKRYIAEKYKKELGKVSVGKSCIRFKKLADADLKVLKKVLQEARRSGGMSRI